MRIAVLDLGTNVFNLLIADISDNKCEIRKIVKMPSFIGSGGFASSYLSEEAISTAVETLAKMAEEIENSGGVDLIKAFATSAVRDAENGSDFTQIVKERFGIEIETISGDREAELIYKGIRESIFLYDEKVLMCDIGGGSNELIIADKKRIYWKESFNLGVVRLKEIFNPDDPITGSQIAEIQNYLGNELGSLWAACGEYKPNLMIGSSGSFDTLRELLYAEDDGTLPALELELDKLKSLHEKLLSSTRGERMQMPGMSPIRVDYMVLGSIFVQVVLAGCHIGELYQSNFSLKEGCMAEIAEALHKE